MTRNKARPNSKKKATLRNPKKKNSSSKNNNNNKNITFPIIATSVVAHRSTHNTSILDVGTVNATIIDSANDTITATTINKYDTPTNTKQSKDFNIKNIAVEIDSPASQNKLLSLKNQFTLSTSSTQFTFSKA